MAGGILLAVAAEVLAVSPEPNRGGEAGKESGKVDGPHGDCQRSGGDLSLMRAMAG